MQFKGLGVPNKYFATQKKQLHDKWSATVSPWTAINPWLPLSPFIWLRNKGLHYVHRNRAKRRHFLPFVHKLSHSHPYPYSFTLPFMYIAACGIGRKQPIGFRPTGCSSAYIQLSTVYIIAPIRLRCNAFFLQYKPFFSVYKVWLYKHIFGCFLKRAAKQLLRFAVQKILNTNRPLFRFHLHLFCMFKYIAQTAVLCPLRLCIAGRHIRGEEQDRKSVV